MPDPASNSIRFLTLLCLRSPNFLSSYLVYRLLPILVFSSMSILISCLIFALVIDPRSLAYIIYLEFLDLVSLPMLTLVSCHMLTPISHLELSPIFYPVSGCISCL